jgi:uncharacterized protein involved in cysteine biosynthesis
MEPLASSAFRAIQSLFAPGMVFILLKSILITLVALSAFFIGSSTLFFSLFGADSWLSWLGSIGSGIMAWFLFPAIMPVIVNFFDTRIVRLIEEQEYPGAAKAVEPPFMKEFLHDAKFTAKALLLNLLALPFYLIPIVNLLLFYGLNGYLLGKEFFIMVARQHMPIESAVELHRRHSQLAGLGGTALAIMATIPIVNLFAPIWGIALMVHVYHSVQSTTKSAILPPL